MCSSEMRQYDFQSCSKYGMQPHNYLALSIITPRSDIGSTLGVLAFAEVHSRCWGYLQLIAEYGGT